MSFKSVLITGCSQGGIGSQLAFSFQEAGLLVFATARTPSKIDPALAALPNVEVLELDVSSASSIAAAVKAVEGRASGRLDVLINNAGYGLPGPAMEIDLDAAKKMFDVNFWSALAVTQAFIPLLIRAKGTVVNNSSVGAYIHMPFNSLYAASKASLNAVGEIMRLELAPYGVKVVTLATGGVRTHFLNNAGLLNLKDDSLYKKIEDSAQASLAGKGKGDEWMQMPVETYATKASRDILRGANGVIWRGGGASITWFLTTFLPTSVVDWFMTNGVGLETLP